MSRPTITDVAKLAGVSKGLVSFVFNGREGVAEDTRVRVLRAADELGWRPNPSARSLVTRSAYALGLVVLRDPDTLGSDPFFPAFIAGVESVLADSGKVMVVSVVSGEDAELEMYSRLAAEGRVDGVFLTDLRHKDPRIGLLGKLGVPAVTLGRPDEPSPFPVVDRDYGQGITQVVEHLHRIGHTKIAHVTGDLRLLHGTRRSRQFHDAVSRLGLDPIIVEADFSPEQGAVATRSLLSRREPPTAIVFANDPMAIAGMAVASEMGRRLPDDLSVCGLDGTPLARFVFPSLTTVGSEPDEWGKAATRALLDLVETGTVTNVDLPAAQLILRGSVGSQNS